MEINTETTPLSELVSYLSRGVSPSYTESSEGLIVINQKCIRDQRLSVTDARRTDTERKPVTDAKRLRILDVVVNSTGVGTLGRVAQVRKLDEPATADSHVTIVRADPEKVEPRYLGVAMRLLQPLIEAMAEGSTGQTELSRIQLGNLPIPILSDVAQSRVADIAFALDDKIELNRRMSATLEEMARALFKSWFIDFDPVHAKAEGRPTNLPPEIEALFPDSFEDSELGPIPKGWKVLHLGELLELAYGKALKAEVRRPGEVRVYGSNGQVGWHDESIAEGPGVIVGRKGNPGTVTWSEEDYFVIDTAFYVVAKQICPSLYFLYHALREQNLATLGADSAVPGLNRGIAYRNEQVLPTRQVLHEFDLILKSFSKRREWLEKESRSLSDLRDTLLPKLIAGWSSSPVARP